MSALFPTGKISDMELASTRARKRNGNNPPRRVGAENHPLDGRQRTPRQMGKQLSICR